jgi:hypothetical protein
LVALVGGLAVISGALASPAAVGIGSATVEPGADVTVALTVDPASGEEVGALTIDIEYAEGLTVVDCDTQAGGDVCNKDFVEGTTIRYTIAATEALDGTLAAITFTAPDAVGDYDLSVTVSTCADLEGGDLTCTSSDGTITVAEPTPTPSPTPAPTATPTATPAPSALPQTGGAPSDSSTSSLAWVLGALGLAVLAGGVWAVSRTRRESL